jgi:hypothetical protein
MQKSRVRRVGALLVGLSLVAAACGDDDDEESASTSAPAEETTATTAAETTETTAADTTETTATGDTTEDTTETTAGGGGDAECGKAPSDVTNGDLAGFKGTTPFGVITDEFIARLCEVDPNLEDLNYASETYDAIMITALAVEVAGDDGIAHASEINGVTRDGEKCTTFADCKALIEAGTDIDYDGVAGPLTFAGNGEPIVASYGLLQMGDNNRIDPELTEYIEVTGPPEADVPQVPVEGSRAGDGVLTIGSILPQTGSLAFLGPPEFAGFDVAINEINDNGGVLGQPVVGIKGDSGDTSTNQAEQTVDRLLSENVDVIIGAASSGVSLSVIDKITSAGVTQFSPANTSPELSDYADKGLYFRTAPPDVYQGDVLGHQPQRLVRQRARGPGDRDDRVVGRRGRRAQDVRPRGRLVRHRGRRDRGRRPGRDPRDRVQRVVADPPHDGGEGCRPAGQGGVRLRRQHRQRPGCRLRRRRLTDDITRGNTRTQGPGPHGPGPCACDARSCVRRVPGCRGTARSPSGR